jgi:hypothetical protein
MQELMLLQQTTSKICLTQLPYKKNSAKEERTGDLYLYAPHGMVDFWSALMDLQKQL